jgi:LysM repeat protein
MSLLRMLPLLLCCLFAGCQPGAVNQSDEQKEPYFLAGKKRLQERDYQGAIDMFEKALDVNPRSASAHFELAVLYEQQQNDYVGALFHYHRVTLFNSNAPFADLSRQRMQECKRELSKSVVQPLSMEHLQREADSLRAENQQLRQQLAAAANTTPRSAPAQPQLVARNDVQSPVRTNAPSRSGAPPGSNRVHTIAAGDTLGSIARRYNVKVSALQSANPALDERRLRPGQTVVIPAP